MTAKKTHNGPIQKWGKKIHWEKRVKAVCKPCWEIKYCPYGPLVEDFPLLPPTKAEAIEHNIFLKEQLAKGAYDEERRKMFEDEVKNFDPDDYPEKHSKEDLEMSCRIYGHKCPVFSVAEPLTETRELRNISREIPRKTQFRVLKRENQICSICGNSIRDEDYEFDHIIPWIKGGSSDENNIRLLCRDCNRKKGKRFEDDYLVKGITEHVVEPVGIEVISLTLQEMELAHEQFKEEGKYPNAVDICKSSGRRKVQLVDEWIANEIATMNSFFNTQKPTELKQKVFKALKYRWGFSDREVHKLKETAKTFGIKTTALLEAELSFMNRLGWQIKYTETTKKSWLRL